MRASVRGSRSKQQIYKARRNSHSSVSPALKSVSLCARVRARVCLVERVHTGRAQGANGGPCMCLECHMKHLPNVAYALVVTLIF